MPLKEPWFSVRVLQDHIKSQAASALLICSDEYLLRAQCARIMPNTEGNMALASRDLKSSREGKLSK